MAEDPLEDAQKQVDSKKQPTPQPTGGVSQKENLTITAPVVESSDEDDRAFYQAQVYLEHFRRKGGGARSREWDSGAVSDFHKKLFLADYLSPSAFKSMADRGALGMPNQDTYGAVLSLFRDAKLANMSPEELLKYLMTMDVAKGRGGGGRAKIRLSPTEDIKKIADEAGQDVIGRGLTEPEAQKVVSARHSQERGSQTEGGRTEDPTSVESIAETQLRKDKPLEAEATDAMRLVSAFLGMAGVTDG